MHDGRVFCKDAKEDARKRLDVYGPWGELPADFFQHLQIFEQLPTWDGTFVGWIQLWPGKLVSKSLTPRWMLDSQLSHSKDVCGALSTVVAVGHGGDDRKYPHDVHPVVFENGGSGTAGW